VNNTNSQSISLNEKEVKISYFYTTVENLRVREAPNLKSQVLTTLKKNTQLIYLNKKSEHSEKITLRKKTYHSHWFKIKLEKENIIGWVYGGAISKEKAPYYTNCEKDEVEVIRQKLRRILKHSNLDEQYRVRCDVFYNYYIEGDFNGDEKEDIAILIESNILDERGNYLTGVLISPKDNLESEPIILGVGLKEGIRGAKATFDDDDYTWVGVFETVNKGDTLEPNWNIETNDWYDENDIIPKEKKVYLANDAMYLHQEGSCGGGYIYWEDGKFHWINLDG
jgi:uncharacterized protein YgiM (DUF1202 family)